MNQTLWGPFTQLVTLRKIPAGGPVRDEQLEVIEEAGMVVDESGRIVALGRYSDLEAPITQRITQPTVAMPGFVDCHTHMCFAGSRAADYQRRLAGATYQEIAAAGGGIKDSMRKTRAASQEQLTTDLVARCQRLVRQGVTTCEVKSGYGLNVADELKILRAIHSAQRLQKVQLIPTCLAAHTTPPEYSGNSAGYLQMLSRELLPQLGSLTRRIDIFVDSSAFSIDEARTYLMEARRQGFALTIHADQFAPGGAQLAAEVGALSADHLEATREQDFHWLSHAGVVPVVLPGATLGLGQAFPPARALLDAGLPLAIASDWNPGSAPMGHLLLQAALLGAAQKLSMGSTIAGITARAAQALGLTDRGVLDAGMRADLALFPTNDYREILYHQGMLLPYATVIEGADCTL